VKRPSILGGLFLLGALALSTGCATQHLDIPATEPDLPAGEAFENSGYSWYVLIDLVTVSETKVQELIAEVNPMNLPVKDVEVTSNEDWLASLVNILNGGTADRGLIVSMNRVKVRGHFAAPR